MYQTRRVDYDHRNDCQNNAEETVVGNMSETRHVSENIEINMSEPGVAQGEHDRQLYNGQAPASDSVGVPIQIYAFIYLKCTFFRYLGP